jgi:hypothetical protein
VSTQGELTQLPTKLEHQRLSRTLATLEICFGLGAVSAGLWLNAGLLASLLFVLGGYLALAGHRSHLYPAPNERAAYLAGAIHTSKQAATRSGSQRGVDSMTKIVFLDIDGVLNDGYPSEPFILPLCAKHFNRLLQETGAKVVISSSWRIWVHGGHMTERGFQGLLRTHGIACQVVGVTPADGKVRGRGKQIAAWLAENGPVQGYVVLDDSAYDLREHGHPLVQTDGTKGLSEQDVVRAIELLTESLSTQAPPDAH